MFTLVLVFSNMSQVAMVTEARVAGKLFATHDTGVPNVGIANFMIHIMNVVFFLVTKC